jgi:hypothetical protein
MLASDGEPSARRAAAIFDDERVAQFHDPDRHAGDAFGALANGHTAWDIYMLFEAGTRWGESAPAPVDWMHQLGGGRADPGRARTGYALPSSLHDAMKRLGHEPAFPVPGEAEFAGIKRATAARIASRRAAEEGVTAQCARCSESVPDSQCRLSGWRYVSATRVESGAAGVTIEVGGSTTRPAAFDAPPPASLDLLVRGMTCEDCTLNVAVQALSHRGVRGVHVGYDEGRALVELAPDAAADRLDAVVTTLRLAGYEARPAGAASRIQLLRFEGCPMTAALRRNLHAALAKLDVDVTVEEVDLEALPKGDPLLRYGSPTVLVDGADVMGAAPGPSAALSCRVYPDGLPDSSALAERLTALDLVSP